MEAVEDRARRRGRTPADDSVDDPETERETT
jgi:hypothetical protein